MPVAGFMTTTCACTCPHYTHAVPYAIPAAANRQPSNLVQHKPTTVVVQHTAYLVAWVPSKGIGSVVVASRGVDAPVEALGEEPSLTGL